MENIMEIENLNYKNIFKNFNISIKKNQFITISGPNKCGKTTLIKILDRQIKTNNSIKLNNRYLEDYNIKDLKERIGTVIFADDNSFLFNTVEEELMFLLDNKDIVKAEKIKRYKEIIKRFKLNKYQNVNPNTLYKNLQIKLKLAMAIILKPDILLLDDICSRMSRKETTEIHDILKYLKEEEKMTVIMTTDNLEETIASDILYIVSDGNVLLKGKPLDVLEKDNVLNRLGLELPFMMDLSVKLRDYDLIKEPELDMDRMVDILWK